MKKLMTAVAACAFAGLAIAQVESVNVVGYTTKVLNSKNTMVGLNFTDVGGGALKISDLIPKDQDGLNAGANAGVADQISVLADGSYTTYFLCNGMLGKLGYVEEADGWCKFGTQAVTTDTIPTGGAFWFISQSASAESPVTLTLAGEVANDATLTKEIKPGLNMLAHGFAAELDFANESSGLNMGVKGANAGVADQISVLADGSYTTYFLCNGMLGKLGYVEEADGWCKFGTQVVTTDTIPMGAAAWYISQGDEPFDWVCPRPYDL